MKLLAVFFFCATVVAGSKILLSAPFGPKSHQNMYIPLIGELAKRGHHVTFITNYESSELKKLSNVRQIVFPQLAIDMNKMPNSFNHLLSQDLFKFEAITFLVNIFWTMMKETLEAVYSHQDIKEMMSNEAFDLVMMSSRYSPAGLPFAWHFKAPIIQISPGPLDAGTASLLGDDENYSYVPFLMTSFSDKMSLKERTINFLISKFFEFMMSLQKSMLLPIAREKFFPNLPPFDEIEKETALILINSHPTFSYPRTLAPQFIEVGGPHCRPPNQLDPVRLSLMCAYVFVSKKMFKIVPF